MPEYQFTSPEGKSYSITGPEGSTREEAFSHLPTKYPELQGKPGFEGAGVATPTTATPAAKSQAAATPNDSSYTPSTAGNLARQMGLTLRNAAAMGAELLTEPADLAMKAAYGVHNLTQTAKRQREVPYSFTETAKKAIDKLGLPKPAGSTEEGVATAFELAPAAVSAGALGVVGAKKLGGKLVDAYKGTAVKEATAKATGEIAQKVQEARTAFESAAAKQASAAQRRVQEAESAAYQRQRLEEKLKSYTKRPTTGLHQIGSDLEATAKAALDTGHQARAKVAKVNYEAASKEAAAKEAAGQFIDTGPALREMQKLAKDVQGVPGLEAQINARVKMLSEPKGTPAGAAEFLGESGSGRTHENAKEILAYLNDVAHKGALQGASPSARRTAVKAEELLMKAMTEHTPAFKVAHDTYREMSVPLEALDTRLMKAVTEGEGGLKGEAFRKVAAQDLPAKFFGDKEGVDLLVNALSGGRNAAPLARAKAEEQVQGMALKYFEEKLSRTAPQAYAKFVGAPEQRGVLEALPRVKVTLERRSGEMLAKEARIKALTGVEERAAGSAAKAAKKAEEFRGIAADIEKSLFKADTLAAGHSEKDLNSAYSAYSGVLEKLLDVGAIAKEDYKAVHTLLDRAQTQSEKLKLIRSVARAGMYLSGLRGASHAAEAATHGRLQK